MSETTFLDLKCKEVVNVVDGKRLGHIIDVIINLRTGRITGLVVPGGKNILGIFKTGGELFIPLRNVCKVGNDVILVELYYNNNKVSSCDVNKTVETLSQDESEDDVS